MTDNHGAAAKPRASTRSTRASQERKEILEAAQALPLAPEAVAASASQTKARETSPTAGAAAATPASAHTDESVAVADTASEAAAGIRRSTRRGAATAATNKPAQPQHEPEESAASSNDSTEKAAAKNNGKDTAAQGGASVMQDAAKTSAPHAGESPENGADSESQAEKRGAHKRAASDDDVSRAAKAAKESKAMTPTQSDGAATAAVGGALEKKSDATTAVVPMETSSLTTTSETTPAAASAAGPSSSDLKRSADAVSDAHSDSHSGGLMQPKAKRVRKTREEKLAILAFVDDGGTHVAAAEKFGVSRTAVTKMVKERDIIMSGLSGKQHAAAANGSAPAAAAAAAVAGGTFLHTAAVLGVTALATDNTPTPAARKSRAASASSTAAPAAARGVQPSTGDGGSTGANPKARRVRKTNEEKLLILEFVERGGSQGAAAEKFGVSRTAVTKMVKEKEAITAQVMSGKSNHRKVLQYQHKLSIIEDMLYKWQVQVENDAPNLKITGDLLQSKAVEFRDKILADWKGSLEPEVVQSLSDFKASNGWLHRYLQRRNLRTASKREYHRRSPPSATGCSVPASPSDPFNMSMFVAEISQRLKVVPVQCIWNMDEVALLPKSLAAASLKDAALEGVPVDRMTIALMVNAAGEKFKPQVLISESYVEKLEALQKAQPNLVLTSQQSAWQDTTALALYLHAVSAEAKQRMETWYILMDASPSHVEFAQLVDPAGSFDQGYRFENLLLFLMPPTATLEHHPVHHGVSRVFKAAYRQSMLTAVVQMWMHHGAAKQTDAATEAAPPFDVRSHIDASDEVAWVSQAWDAVPSALIRHCWVRNGLLSAAQLAQISQDNSRAVEAELFRTLSDTVAALSEQDGGALAQALGLPTDSSTAEGGTSSLLDQVNALITLDDHESTERKLEILPSSSQVITETDANGDLRALV